MKPRLLDLFCGAGGAAMGYHRAGFEVVGVDIKPQPNYPFEFHRADALVALDRLRDPDELWPAPGGYVLDNFDAIHASPPCQAHVKGLAEVNRSLGRHSAHRNLIGEVRYRLQVTGLSYVIENVVGAPLLTPIRLCGSSFGLAVQRHRLFESNSALMAAPCAHHLQTKRKFWTSWRPDGEPRLSKVVQVYGNAGDSSEWAEAMGIDWMTRDELREAIPPSYTTFIGHQLMNALRVPGAA